MIRNAVPSHIRSQNRPAPAPAPSIGTTFATKEGPWPKYLNVLARSAPLAGEVVGLYRRRLWEPPADDVALRIRTGPQKKYTSREAYSRLRKRDSLARIIDIDTNNNVENWKSITADSFIDLKKPDLQARAMKVEARAREVDDFIRGLHDSGTGVHTRILLLHCNFSGSNSDVDPAILKDEKLLQDLFFGHVLGIEYEMNFAEVHYILQLSKSTWNPIGGRFGNNARRGCMTFKQASIPTFPVIRCYRLGIRSIGTRQVDHGKQECSNNATQLTTKWSCIFFDPVRLNYVPTSVRSNGTSGPMSYRLQIDSPRFPKSLHCPTLRVPLPVVTL